MKNLIFAITIFLSTVILSGCFSDSLVPEITEGVFPFHFKIEVNDEIIEMEDIIEARFTGIRRGWMGFGWHRHWRTEWRYESFREHDQFANASRINILSVDNMPSLRNPGTIESNSTVWVSVGWGGYYLGCPNLRQNGPRIRVSERLENQYGGSHIATLDITKEQAYELFGISILIWEFSEPIQNRFIRQRSD